MVDTNRRLCLLLRPAWTGLFLACILLCGCAPKQVNLNQIYDRPHPEEEKENLTKTPQASPPKAAVKKAAPEKQWKKRVVTEAELQKLRQKDPELNRLTCLEILARLNGKASYYIARDIKAKRPMKVPLDFHSFKTWSPLPDRIECIKTFPKLILVVKNIPFIGWYEKGKLVGDTIVCIGKKSEWTPRGLYKVEEKDEQHVSQSYPNAYGRPAAMPMALKVYKNIWIHAGDVVGGYSSHGCINLPFASAEALFRWAEIGTAVLITASLKDLQTDLNGCKRISPSGSAPQKASGPPSTK
ncbi:L,D-transpeptidase [Desulforhabdus sp. TSK]|uniref:L,D-transpeptidase n=1 Tax=Desulforhabdus sp. TSK TaxID=2925014 RepID=UPI001FC8CF52|nr:L,D-transpeptidase [Desulforhabdus sp. TSK]GKT09992.1 hypothetical protein DSTSK_32970 [Desulforhabdus sp. TSK]